MKNITKITHGRRLLAFIVKAAFYKDGIEFFTPDNFSIQMGHMMRRKGHAVTPHIHPVMRKRVKSGQEVVIVKSGKVRVDFYDKKKDYVRSYLLKKGDIVFMAEGGHGFKFMEDAELIEVKQGPFFKKANPERFMHPAKDRIRIKA